MFFFGSWRATWLARREHYLRTFSEWHSHRTLSSTTQWVSLSEWSKIMFSLSQAEHFLHPYSKTNFPCDFDNYWLDACLNFYWYPPTVDQRTKLKMGKTPFYLLDRKGVFNNPVVVPTSDIQRQCTSCWCVGRCRSAVHLLTYHSFGLSVVVVLWQGWWRFSPFDSTRNRRWWFGTHTSSHHHGHDVAISTCHTNLHICMIHFPSTIVTTCHSPLVHSQNGEWKMAHFIYLPFYDV